MFTLAHWSKRKQDAQFTPSPICFSLRKAQKEKQVPGLCCAYLLITCFPKSFGKQWFCIFDWKFCYCWSGGWQLIIGTKVASVGMILYKFSVFISHTDEVCIQNVAAYSNKGWPFLTTTQQISLQLHNEIDTHLATLYGSTGYMGCSTEAFVCRVRPTAAFLLLA